MARAQSQTYVNFGFGKGRIIDMRNSKQAGSNNQSSIKTSKEKKGQKTKMKNDVH